MCSERSSQVLLPKTVFAGETSTSWFDDDSDKDIILDGIHIGKPSTKTEVGISSTPLSSRTTITNRHARLIDGSIFTAKQGGVDYVACRGNEKDHGDAKRSMTRSSWSAVRQKEPLRHSLIYGVRGIFRKDQQQQHSLDQTKHRRDSSFLHDAINHRCEMTSPKATSAAHPSDHLSVFRVNNHFLGLDGTWDEELDLCRPFNLNKPLPASPGNPGIGIKQFSSVRGTPLSEQFQDIPVEKSQDTPIRPSTASSVSSNLSTTSSKRDFRGLTRTLVNETMSAHRHDLSPVREAENLSPTKYDPRTSSVYS